MKKITISLNGDTYRRARMKAAEQNTSVSALVKRYLTELTSGKTETKTPQARGMRIARTHLRLHSR